MVSVVKKKKKKTARKGLVITVPGTCEVPRTKESILISPYCHHHLIIIMEIPLLARSEPHAFGLLVYSLLITDRETEAESGEGLAQGHVANWWQSRKQLSGPPDPPWDPHPFSLAPSPAQALLWGAQGRVPGTQSRPGRAGERSGGGARQSRRNSPARSQPWLFVCCFVMVSAAPKSVL